MKAILTCVCAGAPKYCESSFKTLFPNEPLPPIYIKNKATAIYKDIPSPSEMRAQIETILRRRGRYGYYYEYDEEGRVLKCWNLLKHKEVK